MKKFFFALAIDTFLWTYTFLVGYKVVYEKMILNIRYPEFSWSQPGLALLAGLIASLVLHKTPLSIGRAANGLNRGAGDRDANIIDPLVVSVRLNEIRVVNADAPIAQRTDMVVVTVLVEGDQKIGVVSRGENFARAQVHLENGWPSGDSRRNRHVGHDLPGAASCQTRQETANGLDPILRISGKPDHRILNVV